MAYFDSTTTDIEASKTSSSLQKRWKLRSKPVLAAQQFVVFWIISPVISLIVAHAAQEDNSQ